MAETQTESGVHYSWSSRQDRGPIGAQAKEEMSLPFVRRIPIQPRIDVTTSIPGTEHMPPSIGVVSAQSPIENSHSGIPQSTWQPVEIRPEVALQPSDTHQPAGTSLKEMTRANYDSYANFTVRLADAERRCEQIVALLKAGEVTDPAKLFEKLQSAIDDINGSYASLETLASGRPAEPKKYQINPALRDTLEPLRQSVQLQKEEVASTTTQGKIRLQQLKEWTNLGYPIVTPKSVKQLASFADTKAVFLANPSTAYAILATVMPEAVEALRSQNAPITIHTDVAAVADAKIQTSGMGALRAIATFMQNETLSKDVQAVLTEALHLQYPLSSLAGRYELAVQAAQRLILAARMYMHEHADVDRQKVLADGIVTNSPLTPPEHASITQQIQLARAELDFAEKDVDITDPNLLAELDAIKTPHRRHFWQLWRR